MATTIKIKNSVTATTTPTSLVQGEVAINVTDKKVWVGNAASSPVQLLGAGSSASFGALTCTSLTNSGLTSGRVTYAGASGLLSDSTDFVWDNSNTRLGIGINSPVASIDVLGSYFNGGSSRTNTNTKTFGFRVPHCTTATSPMNVIGGLSTTSVNYVYIGGSDSNIGGTAATNLFFYTAANNTTADGTLRMSIDSGGIVTMSAYGAGAATFSGSGVISSVSDETWKTKDGVPTNPDVMLQKLEPGYWFYNEEKAPTFGADRQLGFYAQNVHEAIGAEAAPTPEEGKPWGYYDRSVLAIAVMSLKNALTTIEELKQKITALESR
jgi:hypothetical protein